MTILKSSIQVDFHHHLRSWDGFGINYVEASQTRDYAANPQDYGGFSMLPEQERQEILDLIFGPDGLRPGIIKMFLDPFHQTEPGAEHSPNPDKIDLSDYDHATTTKWMRYFAREGQARIRANGADLQAIITLYGPPGWMTQQRFTRGRDLDPQQKIECAKYMISWAKYLREIENINVKFISLHNEGEDWERWPRDGSAAGADNHDYNLYWPPEQVAEFIRMMPAMLKAQGLGDIGVTPGETTNWYRFTEWGYADAIADDTAALQNLGLITSHGFTNLTWNRWFADWRSTGIDTLRNKRPELHAWVTSTSWGKMNVDFLSAIRDNIYAAKVNAVIPWAGVQLEGKWIGGDPNPGCAIKVLQNGTYRVEPGYHFYKQICRAGQPGMAVARILSNDTLLNGMAFSRNGTKYPDAFVVLNLAQEEKDFIIQVNGSTCSGFEVYSTSEQERYLYCGTLQIDDHLIHWKAAPRSAATFYGLE